MDLQKAIEILKIEKGCAELDISNDRGNNRTQNFVDAVNCILDTLELEH